MYEYKEKRDQEKKKQLIKAILIQQRKKSKRKSYLKRASQIVQEETDPDTYKKNFYLQKQVDQLQMHQGGAQAKLKQQALNGNDAANQLAQQQLLIQQQQQLQEQLLNNSQQQASSAQQQVVPQSASNQGGQQSSNAASAAAGTPSNSSSTIGQGTTNQQRLKSHVQQFVNKIRKENDKFYKQFVEVCKNNRESDKCFEFHSEIRKLFLPYGDLLMEINKMMHPDYQYQIPEQSLKTTLKDSFNNSNELNNRASTSANANSSSANGNAGNSIRESDSGKQKNDIDIINSNNQSGNNKQRSLPEPPKPEASKEVVTQKLSQFCQVIRSECPDKMDEFVNALRQRLKNQEDQLRLFIQTCEEIFGEDHPIYQKAQILFQELPQNSTSQSENNESTANNIQQISQGQLVQNIVGPSTGKARKDEEKEGRRKKNKNASNANSVNNASQSGPLDSKNNNSNTLAANNQSKETVNGNSSSNANQNTTTQSSANQNQQNSNGYVKGSVANKDTNHSSTPNGNNLLNVNQGSGSYKVPSTRLADMGSEQQSVNRIQLMGDGDGPGIPKSTIQGATKSEQNFIYLIDTHMDPIAFMNMLKLLYLYVECIITASEMIEQGSYLLQGFNNPEKLIEQLKDLVECRESSRRKATPYFKPLNDFDFNHHERFTHSYVEMPKFYPKYCSNSTELTRSVLNTSIVTVPQGTEHVTFSIMRKNQYEEQLFKSEDEKYEYDHHIQMYRRTIKLLEQVEQCEDPEQCRRLMQQAIDLKMIVCLYKNGSPEQQEICEILLSNPKKTVLVALERVRSKLKEIEEAKMNQARKQWHEVAEKNFHRSLDHRSFIFKRHDRKFTVSTRFEKEPEFRNRMLMRISSYMTHQQTIIHKQQQYQQQQQQLLQMQQGSTRSAGAALVKNQHLNDDGIENTQDFETDVSSYFQFLNTFQGTTNIEKCSHASHEDQLIKFDYQNVARKFALPMMAFIFEDPQICEDTFSLLMHYQQYATINQSDREKIKRTAQLVLKGFFDLTFKPIEHTDITLNENKVIRIVTEIENKIFEKIQAYLRPVSRDGTEIPFGNDKNGKGQDGEAIAEENEEATKEGEKNKSDEKSAEEEGEEKDANNDEKEKKKDGEEGACKQKGKNTKSPSSNCLNSANKKQQSKDNNDNDMELETEGNEQRKNKSQESGDQNEGNQDKSNHNNQSSLNDILDDENSKTGEKIREMSFKMDQIDENFYLPKIDPEQMIGFYGTKNLYIFLRFFYVLYERLYKAQEISRYFEDNEKTQKLTDQEKEELSKERYQTFKNILIGSLKQRETKYEDYLRSIFGKQAFLMFTIDKTLQATIKSLQTLATDDLSQKLLHLYIHPEDHRLRQSLPSREEILYVKINKIILDSTTKNNSNSSDNRSFFRFTRVLNSNILYINYIDSIYKNWEIDQINKSREYFNFYMNDPTPKLQNKTNNSELPIYLSRNKRKNADKLKQKQLQVFQQNNIEYHTYSNTNHIINSNNQKEDYLVSSSKLKRRAVPLDQLVEVEFNKTAKFESWYNKQTESLIQLKRSHEPRKQCKTTSSTSNATSISNTAEEAEQKTHVNQNQSSNSVSNTDKNNNNQDQSKNNNESNLQNVQPEQSEMKE
ncbi:ubiquitin carboxyl-terminal hydrolase family protein (macronuclear) [Tetrahymena thermophila SB210]|uniref:Ubiquitin carboxyl-terminal hydrolase family protein n=1 Tax=Tetrahymena thermophila (strain SB210) TaxID=312017 RepID=Q238S4_TETTS|nr:ubiquitin carboxyl-terminal hydrolase family protein [Tetrahymena thermophila SB210]EAR93146.2 ubiquitin carboxyl-terminal hydrolase family protein [Tetrahymena thermophila SB210]|eukprot:XP_001013391.2 ubiquitin carboxyl-terminal hydrolase family protein [Tetrahymena thermophila SB210]